MQGWVREVRIGAAREWGARHYRGIAAAELAAAAARRLGLPLLALGVAGGLGWWGWHVAGRTSIPWPAIGIVLAVVAGLVLVAWLRLLVPVVILLLAAAAGWLTWQAVVRWQTGAVAVALAVLGALFVAVTVSRRRRCRRRLGLLPAAGAPSAFAADAGWLAGGRGPGLVLGVGLLAILAVLAVVRLRRTAPTDGYELFD